MFIVQPPFLKLDGLTSAGLNGPLPTPRGLWFPLRWLIRGLYILSGNLALVNSWDMFGVDFITFGLQTRLTSPQLLVTIPSKTSP